MKTHKITLCPRRMLTLAFVLVVSASTVRATTITNTTIADSQIFGGDFTNANRGAQVTMAVGDIGVGTDDRPVLQFSLANIPTNQTILSAQLRLTINFTGGIGQNTNDFYRLLVPWVEGNGVTGFASGTSGVTWDRRDKAGTLPNWVVPGAGGSGTDRAPSPSFSTTAGDLIVSGLITNLVKNVTSDVQAWYSGSVSNYGWLIQAQTFTSGSGNFTVYYAKEQGNPGGADVPPTPALIIQFEPIPEPTTVALIGLGGLLWLRRRSA